MQVVYWWAMLCKSIVDKINDFANGWLLNLHGLAFPISFVVDLQAEKLMEGCI
jgi:hypothetical protein